jgi:hypothetical protein
VSEELTITYMRLDEVARWPRNVKKHDIGALVESIRRYGMIDPLPGFAAFRVWQQSCKVLVMQLVRTDATAHRSAIREFLPAPQACAFGLGDCSYTTRYTCPLSMAPHFAATHRTKITARGMGCSYPVGPFLASLDTRARATVSGFIGFRLAALRARLIVRFYPAFA